MGWLKANSSAAAASNTEPKRCSGFLASMRKSWAPRGGLVRFSIGLEATEDLQADLLTALSQL